jgi:alkanesulfonate monooxygenase SsuD/methylene tetrahydromethanopterin reductase-like flavin-dependent oxidoreductase (luciferase family)
MAVEFGIFPVPSAESHGAVLDQVLAAERAGLDLVGIQDHPYQRRFLDTWSLIPFLAARTERIRFFPDVANLPLRPPAGMAKAAASIDILSGGRFELGLGAGAFWEGIGAMGGPVHGGKESVDALEEAIQVIRLMWSGERSVSFKGEHYSLDGVHPGPPPAHPIGIWLGAYGPRMMRVVGRLADGWIPSIPRLPLDEVPAKQAAIDEAAEAAGRDPFAIRRIANVSGRITDPGEGATGFLEGPVEHWVEELTRLVSKFRFDGFVLASDPGDPEQIERFGTEVAPAVRAAVGGPGPA